jgi:hypothetical protein
MASSVFVGPLDASTSARTLRLESTPNITSPTADFQTGLSLTGDTTAYSSIEIHNRYAVAIDMYTHDDAGFRAPYVNFYKSRGSQATPTPPTLTGYETDSLGGINFSGWTGSAYEFGCGIYTQVMEDWGPGKRGAAVSIYGRNNNGGNGQQLIQFGGIDSVDQAARNSNGVCGNIISYRPLVFHGNRSSNVGLFPVSANEDPQLHVKNGLDNAYAKLFCGPLTLPGGLVTYGANDSAGAGFRLLRVPNA